MLLDHALMAGTTTSTTACQVDSFALCRSSSLTAPNGLSQQAVMLESLREGCAGPSDVAMLQLHGTGTTLGDPIEAGAAIGAQCHHEHGRCFLCGRSAPSNAPLHMNPELVGWIQCICRDGSLLQQGTLANTAPY